MVHGLAEIVQQAGAFGLFYVHAQFRRHHSAEGGNFQRVLQDVLRVACSVAELPEVADKLGVDAVHAGVEGGLLAHFADLHVEFLLAFVHHVLDAGGVDSAVLNEALQRHFRHLPAQGAVGGEDDGFRRVVDDQIHACGCFQRADVAAFAPDDPPLHVFAGQGDGRDGVLAHIVASVALNAGGDDFLGLSVGCFPRFGLNKPGHARRFVPGARFDFLKQASLRFLGCQAGNFLQAAFLFRKTIVQLLFKLGQAAFLAAQFFFRPEDFVFLFRGLFEFFLKAFALFLQFAIPDFEFALAFLELVLQLPFLIEKFILPLQEDFFFLRLRFLAGFFDDACGQFLGIANAFGAHMSVERVPRAASGDQGRDGADNGDRFHAPSGMVSGACPVARRRRRKAPASQGRPRMVQTALCRKSTRFGQRWRHGDTAVPNSREGQSSSRTIKDEIKHAC